MVELYFDWSSPMMRNQLNDAQIRRMKKLAQDRCCNYCEGNCLMLDWTYCSICPQAISNHLCCSWFRNAVLPNDPILEAQIIGKALKRCTNCGNPFVPGSNRAKYCHACSARRQREAKRLWAQKKKYGN